MFLGPVAGISLENQVFFLTNYLCADFSCENLDFFAQVAEIIKKIGVSKSLELLNLCEEAVPLVKSEFLLQRFLEFAENFNFIEKNSQISLKTAINQQKFCEKPNELYQNRLISAEKPANFQENAEKTSFSLSFSAKPSFFEGFPTNSLENTGNSQFLGKLGSEFEESLRSGWSERE